MDEGSVLVHPELVQHGAVPYRDFETFYAPANPCFRRFDSVERSVGLLYRVLILLAVFCLTQRWGPAVAIGTTLLTGAALLVTDIVACAWMGSLACALWYVWLITRRNVSLASLFVAGCLAGSAVLFRVDLAHAIMIASLPLQPSFSWRKRAMIALGGAVALLPLGVLFETVGFQPMLDNLFIYPVLRSSPGRHIPLYAADPAAVRLFFVHVLATLVNIAAGLKLWLRRPGEQRDRTLLCVSLLAAGITHQAWQRLDLFHVMLAAFLSIGLLPAALMVLGSSWPARLSNTQGGAAAAVLAAILVSFAIPEVPSVMRWAVTDAFQIDPAPTFRVAKKGRWFRSGRSEQRK